jgi:hypothetical protein
VDGIESQLRAEPAQLPPQKQQQQQQQQRRQQRQPVLVAEVQLANKEL